MWTNASMMWRGVSGAIVGSAMLFASSAGAAVVSDQSGAILVFPKIVVDTDGELGPSRDTLIQLTNTSNSVVSARCFFVNATGHCSNNPAQACTDATVDSDCGSSTARCVPQWAKRDFRLTLTKRQPITWRASEGLLNLPCTGPASCPFGQTNDGLDGSPSSIPPVQEDPFYGELRCIQVDPETFEPRAGFNPANDAAGDLKGEATIVTVGEVLDARKYNAVALQSTQLNDGDDFLQIGDLPGQPGTAEYSACPAVLTLNHLFDNAIVSTGSGANAANVTTDLTVVPCSQDYLNEVTSRIVLQFLIFNEFEQRFSASTNFDCWREVQLSDIDSRPGPVGNSSSIFNVAVQGTLAGQTRIRPVASGGLANGILGVAEESWLPVAGGIQPRTNATNIHFSGSTAGSDRMILSPDSFNP